MGKKKSHIVSLFSTLTQQINEHDGKPSSSEYRLIDNEYFAAFNSLDDIQQFHSKITKKSQEQSLNTDDDNEHASEDDNNDMDMKSFAQQYLVDLPEHLTKATESTDQIQTSSQDVFSANQSINWSPSVKDSKKRKSSTPVKLNAGRSSKRKRRNIQDLPQSNDYSFASDNTNDDPLNPPSPNIFQSIGEDILFTEITCGNMNSILSTLDNTSRSTTNEATIAIEIAESFTVKDEPMDSEHLTIETKEEPTELNVIATGSMDFGTSNYSGDLDRYVQNIHLLHQPSTSEEPSSTISSRPKRIRKQKKFYIDEAETITRPRKSKVPLRKKRSAPSPTEVPPPPLQLTDAEIELQFGERLPVVKSELDDNALESVNNQLIIDFEPIVNTPQTPLENARSKLLAALERGHEPDAYLLKIRSRENQIVEVQLAIYGTADWHPHRSKVLCKIEEALRSLRVSWTKIDIHVDNFDIQISTSSQVASMAPSANTTNTNSSSFLKALSDAGPIIVHVHDRRYPQQRFLIKCPCPECSPISVKHSADSSLPVIVKVSPASTPPRRLNPPTILNRTPQKSVSLEHHIDTTFFNELIDRWGRTTVISVTQCVLDLALIVSVHSSLPSLCVPANCPKEDYKKKYQQVIDPLKHTSNTSDKTLSNATSPMIARVVSVNSSNNNNNGVQSIVLSKSPDILTFYNSIKESQSNIRNANVMRSLIAKFFSQPVTTSSSPNQLNLLKNRAIILPKVASSVSISTSPTSLSLLELKNLSEQKRRLHRRSLQSNRYDQYTRKYSDNHEPKQQARCTSIVELKPIMGGSTVTKQNLHSFTRENTDTIVVRDSQNNELRKITTIISTNSATNETQHTSQEVTSPLNNNARVIRLAIAKSTISNTQQQSTNSTSPKAIRLITSPTNDSESNATHSNASVNKGESVPLVPKQINIIRPLSSTSSSITPAIKLSNPILISNKSQQSSTK